MRQKVFLGWPDGGSVKANFCKALLDLQRYELSEPSPDYELIDVDHTSSIYIQENRNELVRVAQVKKADWLFQLDADESFEPTILRQLMRTANAATRPIVFGLYSNVANFCEIGEGSFDVVDCIYAEVGSGAYRNVRPPDNLQPFKVDAAGTGIVLTHMSIYDRIKYPWFWCELIQVINEGGVTTGPQFMNEDIAFCRTARQAGYEIWCDPAVEVTHWKTIPLVPSTLRQFMLTRKKAELEMRGMDTTPPLDGFFSYEEGAWLEAQAARYESVVEIGSWKGASTSFLLRGCKGPVYAVDHFLGSKSERETNHREAKDGHIYEQFMANVGNHENLRVMRMDSMAAATAFETESVDMVFIDGDHDEAAVLADIRTWGSKCRRFLCGHDRDLPGVAAALATLRLPIKEGPGSLWYVDADEVAA